MTTPLAENMARRLTTKVNGIVGLNPGTALRESSDVVVLVVDVVFADVAQPDQARIVGLNAQYFLKNKGNFVISVKASCIDSTAPPEAMFAREVKKLQELQLKPKEQVRPGDSRNHCCCCWCCYSAVWMR